MITELLVIGLVCFLIGYTAGKREGRRQGHKEGSALVPILLREQSLERGRCCFCQAKSDELKTYSTDSP